MKKKIGLLIITIITLCIFNLNVNAEELFRNEFSTNKDGIKELNLNTIELPDFIKNLLSLNFVSTYQADDRYGENEYDAQSYLQFQLFLTLGKITSVPEPFLNGYIKVDVLENSTKLQYIDAYGNTIKSNEIKNEYIIPGGAIRYLIDLSLEYNGKYYCLGINKNTNKISTFVINENLEVEKKIENKIMLGTIDGTFYFMDDAGFSTSNESLTKFTTLDIFSLIPTTWPSNEQIDFLGKQARHYLKLLPKYQWFVDMNYDDAIEAIKLYVEIEKTYDEENPTTDAEYDAYWEKIDSLNEKLQSIAKRNKVVQLYMSSTIFDISNKYLLAEDKETANIKVMNSNGEIIFDKKMNREYAYGMQLVHDYIAIFKRNDNSNDTRVEIYDFNGNIIQTVNSEKDQVYLYLKENIGGFALASMHMPAEEVALTINTMGTTGVVTKTDTNYKSEVYSMPQDVKLNVVGDGNVKVSNNARFGEVVTLDINIPEGQMLKKVRVYDANGKEIMVENNTFVMPNSPVTISAEFVEVLKENPKTGIISFAGLGLASVALYIYFKNKKGSLTLFKRI